MAHAVLVNGLDAGTNCSELWSLFSNAGPGTVTQATTFTPGHGGGAGSAIVFFSDHPTAQTAVDHFDSYPYAGVLLDVQLANSTTAARLLATLSDLQQAPFSDDGGAAATPLTAAAPVEHQTAAGLAFANGSSVPMPVPFPAAASTNNILPSTPAPETTAPAASTAPLPEPPAFTGYNPEEWLPPAQWQLPTKDSRDTGWAAVASSRSKAKAQPAAAAREPDQPAQAAAASQPSQPPEWGVDTRCRIFITGLRPGLTADDLKAHFSRFGQLVDAAVVPKRHIGFLTFQTGDAGQLCLESTAGTRVPELSADGGEPLRLQYRRLDKVAKFINSRHSDACDEPTTRLFIGYLPRTTSKEAVRAELCRHGELTEVMLGGDDDGGDLFCFVQFRRVQDSARAQRAIHGHTLPSLAGARQLIAAFKQPRS